MHIVKLMIPCVFSCWVFKYQGWAPMYLLRDAACCWDTGDYLTFCFY